MVRCSLTCSQVPQQEGGRRLDGIRRIGSDEDSEIENLDLRRNSITRTAPPTPA